jgi:pyruvate,water dikinase
MDDDGVLELTAGLTAARVGGKAATLGRLAAAGFPVPPGLVVTAAGAALSDDRLRARIEAVLTARPGLGTGQFAVRSSAAAEDLPDASYAGLYETFLNVPRGRLVAAIRRCFAAAASDRVATYRASRAPGGDTSDGVPARSVMAVLVQPMVNADAAGVAFTANPVTGDRAEKVVTAVRGLGERLVGGEAIGDQWVVRHDRAQRRTVGEDAIDADQARAVAALAGRVETHVGVPQDIEWAISGGEVVLLQARPMTALPDPVDWTAPGPGLWQRNFRLGEWLAEPMTPLFADWLLPCIEGGYLDGMRDTVGTTVPFRYATVNGWYYNAPPIPSVKLLGRALAQSRGRIIPVLYNALLRVSRNPVAADRALLGRLYRQWHDIELPAYRQLVADVESCAASADPAGLARIVERIGHAAGRHLWFLSIVGGSAWKMEAHLARFVRDHDLEPVLADGVQALLRGLPGMTLDPPPHAVTSIDFYQPTLGELGHPTSSQPSHDRREQLTDQRRRAEADCRSALSGSPRLLRRFAALLDVAQRYATIREEQTRDLTLGWPALRRCAARLGEHLVEAGLLSAADDVYFLTQSELDGTDPLSRAQQRKTTWERQRRLAAPLTLGHPPRLIGDPIARAVTAARGTQPAAAGAIVGQPASAGRAAGPVHLITGPADFPDFHDGEILRAKATAPAWTPLFGRAAAIITDGGTLAAHASLLAREYGIPAVVGTGDATTRLHTSQHVIVDGTAGTITPTTGR